MALFYFIAGFGCLLITFILFTRSLELGERPGKKLHERENAAFVKALIFLVAGLSLIFVFIIKKTMSS